MMRSILDQRMTESDWLTQVVDYAHLRGWLVMHPRPARTERGWRTAIQGDSGFPDLVMARNGRMVIAELKSETGRLGESQKPWLEELGKVAIETTNVTVSVLRPSDWDTVKELLR